MLGLICYVISAVLFFLMGLEIIDPEASLVYIATGLIPTGLALAGVAIPDFTARR